jgi:hypothetical protein
MHEVLERRFAAMGARLSVAERPWHGSPRIDVLSDRRGEYFDISFAGAAGEPDLEVIDVRPRDRHLLLLARTQAEKSKFLLGHDERHWFVAAVPEAARGVTGVTTAKLALQPAAVRSALDSVRPKDRLRRRNGAYVRQGEWFFVPTSHLRVDEAFVLHGEPQTRGRGKPHVLQFAWRTGGTVVLVNRRHPTGISEARFQRLTPQQRRSGSWARLVRDPAVFAKGTIRHPDHATIELSTWHQVLMNTERGARAMQHVAFID